MKTLTRIAAAALLFSACWAGAQEKDTDDAREPLAVGVIREDFLNKLNKLSAQENAAREGQIATYIEAVDAAFSGYQKAGKLEGMVAMRDEKKRMEESQSFPLARKTRLPATVARAEIACKRALERIATTSLTERINLHEANVIRLERLVEEFAKAGEIEDALVAKREVTRARTELEDLRQIGVAKSGGARALPEALRRDLVLYFPFNRDTRAEVTDASGRRHHGSMEVKDQAWFTEGRIGGGCHFHGKQLIKVMRDEEMDNTGPFSIAFWFKSDIAISERKKQAHFYNQNKWKQHRGMALIFDTPGHQTFNFRVNTVAGKWPEDARIDLRNFKQDVWHHFAVTLSGEEMRVYFDGSLAHTYAAKGFNQPADNNPIMGMNVNGTMDEILMYHRVLRAEEVKQLVDLAGEE